MSINEAKNQWVWVGVAAVLALGLIIAAYIASNTIVQLKSAANTITVTGSAKQQIKSDLAVWTGYFSTQSNQLETAYGQLQSSREKVAAYLIAQGIEEKDIIFSSINVDRRNVMLPNGVYSNELEGYTLSQQVELRSSDVDKITDLSREATDLINQGVEIQSYSPQYFYTKLADLKIEMLALATQDAAKRAEQIAENAGSRVGSLRYAQMGVFQITPLYSNDISDYGINDISSLEKEITAVINCQFEVIK
jgi:hypothetical protein